MRLTIPSLIVFSIALAAFGDDLTIVSKVTRDSGDPQNSTSYISSDHIRISQPDGNETILDPKAEQMIVLNGKKKTYYVVTRNDMDALAAKMDEQMNSPEVKKAQEQMKNLPPDVQKAMESTMGGMFAVDVKKGDTSRTIAGYKCDNWNVTIGQFSKSEQCLTTELKLPVKAWDMYRSYADSMKNMMSAFGPMARSMGTMQEQLRKLKGFPLANTTTTSVMGRRSVTTSEVTSITRGSIPASVWEIPAGYEKVDNPMTKAMARRGKS